MKITGKLAIFMLLAALVLVPLQTAQAKGLAEGPVFGSNVTVKSGETLNEDVVVFGGSVSIEKDAKVNGAVVLFGGSLTLDGDVSKDAVVMGGAIKLGANAHIHGNLVAFGAPVDRDPGAKVDGDVVNNPTRPISPITPSVPSMPEVPGIVSSVTNPLWKALSVLGESVMLALLAMLIAMFLPLQMRRVADGVVAQPLIAFGMGLLTLILFIVAVTGLALFSIFIITLIVTIPLIVIISIVFAAACVLGWLAIGMEVGVRIAQMFKGDWPLPLAAGLGVFILNLVAQGIGFIPCIGGLLSGLVGFAGLGAVLMTRFGVRPAAITATPAPVQAVAPPTEHS
ncbi:MAG: hypothetical protein NT121_05485 [Chloroflexi bacterium]|nr:hypothetical protein [Chloroflexota bacterium]